jgi:hypothetical protein
MKKNETWSRDQWKSSLFEAQIKTHILVEDLKEKLEFCLRAGNGWWRETYNCLGGLDLLEATVMTAHSDRGLKADIIKQIQEVICRIQEFQMPILMPYLTQFSTLEKAFAELLMHPVR